VCPFVADLLVPRRTRWHLADYRLSPFPSVCCSSPPLGQETFSKLNALRAHEKFSDRHRRLADLMKIAPSIADHVVADAGPPRFV